MAYDLEEQDQLDAAKEYWKKYGNLVLTVLTVVLLAFAAWRGYGYWQDKKAAEAAVAYEQFKEVSAKNDLAKSKDAAGQVFEKFGDTIYGTLTALQMAKQYLDNGDTKSAKAALQVVIDKAKDDEYKHIAKVRLAGVLLDEKAFDEGLKLLSSDPPARHLGAYADRRGDLQVALSKLDEAKASYKLALEKLEANSPLRRMVQLKLDSLGQ